jgi:hypothetical protein
MLGFYSKVIQGLTRNFGLISRAKMTQNLSLNVKRDA